MIKDITEVSWPGWETVGVLGRGSFGAVYEISRDVLGDKEKAALKVISIPQSENDIQELYNDGYDNESVAETFKSHLKSIVNEYSMMRKLNDCSNVVHCDDFHYEQRPDGIGWDIYIKMELLTPLAQALPDEIPEETVIQVAKDMCAALEVCAKHNIVHRDIKPQNMFVSPNGTYKLGDFGVAKTVERTMGGTKIGTFKYMAPEVYHSQPYGAAADIYSLGLVLYWMLNCRRMPFMPLPPAKVMAGMDGDAANRRLMGEQIPPPAMGSPALQQIVLKACAYDPEDRYKSAQEMRKALDNLGQKAAPAPTPASVSTPAPVPVPDVSGEETVRVRKTEFISENTVRVRKTESAPSMAAPVVQMPVQPREVPPAFQQPAEKPKKKKGILAASIIFFLLVVGAVIALIIILNPGKLNDSATENTGPSAQQTETPGETEDIKSISGDLKVGDVISLGSYEQDNDLTNGKEAILWQVLAVQDGRALVISKYGLDAKPYNAEYMEITWEESSLRTWLNGEFLNTAFLMNDQNRIVMTSVMAHANPLYDTYPGRVTQDKVFLLSIDEANKYFASDSARGCPSTAYATSRGVWTYQDSSSEFSGNCCWWLRTPGDIQFSAAYVGINGKIGDLGEGVYSIEYAVRPAMWIELNN